eukprot:12690725-Ditylum_brightwellii.AAC.1
MSQEGGGHNDLDDVPNQHKNVFKTFERGNQTEKKKARQYGNLDGLGLEAEKEADRSHCENTGPKWKSGVEILDNQMVVKKGLERDMDKEQPQKYGAEARDGAQKVWVMYQVAVVSKLESKLGEEMHSCTPRRLAAQAPSPYWLGENVATFG